MGGLANLSHPKIPKKKIWDLLWFKKAFFYKKLPHIFETLFDWQKKNNYFFLPFDFGLNFVFYLKTVIWLILPVVICLSQRLSHACLSINYLYSETAKGSLNQS